MKFVPAYNKLLAYDGAPVECFLKGAYAKRKFLSKCYMEIMLENTKQDGRWKAFFASCKGKQDDITDAYLQGM